MLPFCGRIKPSFTNFQYKPVSIYETFSSLNIKDFMKNDVSIAINLKCKIEKWKFRINNFLLAAPKNFSMIFIWIGK